MENKDSQLTEHMSFSEFTKTGRAEFQDMNREQAKDYIVNMGLVAAQLESLRSFTMQPILVKSGFRCPELNKAVGGSPTSQHMTGDAVDFVPKDFEDITGLNFIFDWCQRHLNYGQLILENPPNSKPWIHIGMPRPGRKPTVYVFENGAYKKVG